MTDPNNVSRKIFQSMRGDIQRMIDQSLRDKTGVVPGGPYGSFSVDSQGRITNAGAVVGGGTAGLIASCYASASQDVPVASNDIVQFNARYYDPNNLVTTGASWLCIPGAIGWYLMIVKRPILSNGTNWAAGDQVFFDIYTGPAAGGSFHRQPAVITAERSTNLSMQVAFCTAVEITNVTYGMQLHCTHNTGATRRLGSGQEYATIDIVRVL